ncbi:MAG: hypothetical protein LAO56_25395 [Acidobacteriia bacterium]|nr:hypothetical protein [Terriglobia bacterium]
MTRVSFIWTSSYLLLHFVRRASRTNNLSRKAVMWLVMVDVFIDARGQGQPAAKHR